MQNLLQLNDAGQPLVQVWTNGPTGPVLDVLRELNVSILGHDESFHLIEVAVDVNLLSTMATLPGVLSVTPAYKPFTRAGSVQTQGDAILQADLVRAAGYDGSGVQVGVLSDSALRIATSQATGDLPTIVDGYLNFPASDEGRAMLEIVHDIAPGAALANHSAILSETSFASGIRKLAAAGSRVIVDDVAYRSEPFFQDGIIAQAVNDVTAAGVVYVSAAGNDADRAYQATFDPAGNLHDFDPASAVDTRQQITVPSGSFPVLVLQWDDPFYTTAGVTHDFDVRVYNSSGTLVASGLTNNLATQQPLEVISWTSSGNGIYQVEITRTAGAGASVLKYVLSTSNTAASIDEYATNTGTIDGHAAAAGAIAVGAVPYYSPNTIQPFSSHGDATIYFDDAGNRLASPIVRQKPDVVAPDSVNTTFFGTDISQDADTLPNFPGTSAAAPHVAGVAALVLDANPHLTRDEVYSVLTSTAVDLGATGLDSIYGFGRVDAQAAVTKALTVQDVTAPVAQLLSPTAVAGWNVTQLLVRFSEPMNASAAGNAANYVLTGAGGDNSFGTSDDVAYSIALASTDGYQTVTVTFTAPTTQLPTGQYRLTLDGIGGLQDPAGTPINGGADQVISFAVTGKSSIVTIDAGTQLDVRPDGTAVLVARKLPSTFQSQIMVGQVDPGGRPNGPFRSTPADLGNARTVENVDVAVNASGGVVTYVNLEEIVSGEPDAYDLCFQKIGADGRAIGGRFVAASIQAGNDHNLRVDMNGSGAFIIAYEQAIGGYTQYVRAQRFDPAGAPLAPPFTISQQPNARNSVVAIADDGAAVFAWEWESKIYARRFDSNGASIGSEFQIGVNGTRPEIGMAADGSFVVAWQWSEAPYFQQFTSSGVAIGSPVKVFTKGDAPQIGVAADGRFAIAWTSPDGDGSGVFVQRIAADGAFVGERFWVNGGGAGSQTTPRIAMRDNGDFAVSWIEADETGRLRSYAWNAPADVAALGPWVRTPSPLTHSGGPFNSITLTFNEPINPATFDASDVVLKNPQTAIVNVASVSAPSASRPTAKSKIIK